MDPSMASSVGSYFGVGIMVVCLLDDGGGGHVSTFPDFPSFPWQWQVAFVTSDALRSTLKEISREDVFPILVICGMEEIVDLNVEAAFDPAIIWLTSGHVPPTVSAMLSLQSHLLTYEAHERGLAIYETYSIKSDVLARRNAFGHWTQADGLVVPNPVKWERRSNLTGVILVNTFVLLEDRESLGLFPEILTSVQARLNFR